MMARIKRRKTTARIRRRLSCLIPAVQFIGSVLPKIQIHVPDLSPCKSKNVVVGDGFDGHGRLVQKAGVEDFAVHKMLRGKGEEGSSRRSGVMESRVDLESLMDLWKQKKDQWYKKNRKWEPTVVISRYPKDGFDAGQLQHLAAREGIEGAEIMELREASRKHGQRVESRSDVKAAFKILAKLNKRREKLEVVRTSMSEFVQQLEAGASGPKSRLWPSAA
ncbi:hypothetical protein C1H46_035874 [Malus baccata]|uniref:Uncharacterized protein n=1 Tax=Malus baccata TaxID=106549 RepID=A0A540KWP1_MALBA|nr:hypothetical protein C1H46_035874 [Malus baccata]